MSLVFLHGKKINVFADHHGTEGDFTTSATQIMKDIAETGGFSLGNKQEKGLLDKVTNFITKYDNLTYINDKSRDIKSEKLVNKVYLRNTFPRSLYSLAKFLPFETVLEILGKTDKYNKDGKPRDWAYTFTRNEIEKGKIGEIMVDWLDPIKREVEKIPISELIEKNSKNIDTEMENEELSRKYVEKEKINTVSPLIGKFLFHNFQKEGGKTALTSSISYLVARGLGYDAFVSYNPKNGKIFINADGKHDLMPIWEKLNEIIPGYPKPIRNTFMFEPKDPEMIKKMKDISQAKLLEILGMKGDEHVAANKTAEPVAEIWTSENEKELNELLAKIKEREINIEKMDKRRKEIEVRLLELKKIASGEKTTAASVIEVENPVQPEKKEIVNVSEELENNIQQRRQEVADKMEIKKEDIEELPEAKLKIEIEKVIKQFAEKLKEKNVAYKSLEVKSTGTGFHIVAHLEGEGEGFIGRIKAAGVGNPNFIADIKSIDGKIKVVSYDFDANPVVKAFTPQDKIDDLVNTLGEKIKTYIEKDRNKTVARIDIENGILKITYS